MLSGTIPGRIEGAETGDPGANPAGLREPDLKTQLNRGTERMNSGFLLAVLLMVAPALAAATFFQRIEYSTILAATVDVVIASLLYFIRPPVGTFFVDNE